MIKTYSKLESKIDDVIKFIKKEINSGNQIFWVCPLIEESKKLDQLESYSGTDQFTRHNKTELLVQMSGVGYVKLTFHMHMLTYV